MKPFHTIAIPHRDILEGRLTMDVFAADLWEVYRGGAPDEYKDPEIFFHKTYLTDGLKGILSLVEKRLSGNGGDPVLQIQTPFGGGKTHTLISIYHKARQWGAKNVVFVGTTVGVDITPWGMIEQQLTGAINRFKDMSSPGRDRLKELLMKNQPLVILMDEILEYVTKAATVTVGSSTLAEQCLPFMQELTEAVSTLDRTVLLFTLPSSIIEHYDASSEKHFLKLQHITTRDEKISTPVRDDEISQVIRRRLFSSIKDNEVKKVVNEFMDYAERENILPPAIEPSGYRNRFIESYPFMPETIEVLYHRWGSFPSFQRTRGVLRLLSLVVHSLLGSDKPYISLADFDLGNHDIRSELLRHLGPEFNSIIDSDITGSDAGAKKVDEALGGAYKGFRLGTRAATAVFMYSFSGGTEKGATVGEVKRSATTLSNPSSVVAEAAEQLKSKLFYLQQSEDKLFFSNQPNLNRIILTRMENIKEQDVNKLEQSLLRENIKGDKFKVFIWEENTGNIPDTPELKLVLLRKEDMKIMKDIIANKGSSPRVYRNTIFFLFPLDTERPAFSTAIKRHIAYGSINSDKTLNLTDEQKKEVKKELKRSEETLNEQIRRLYRKVALPSREGLKELDLGIPTYGDIKKLDHEIYEKLRGEEIIEKIAPLVIKEKYLSNRDYVLTEQIYQSSLKTPGEARPIDKSVFEDGISEGVRVGLFGLGELKDDRPLCHYYKEGPTISLTGNEILIKETICEEQKRRFTQDEYINKEPHSEKSDVVQEETEKHDFTTARMFDNLRPSIKLRFTIPRGKVANIMGVMNFLQSRFNTLEVELHAKDGSISEQDYEDKIKETFRQLGIEVEENS